MRITVTLDGNETREFHVARSGALISSMKPAAVGKAFLISGMRLHLADHGVSIDEAQLPLRVGGKVAPLGAGGVRDLVRVVERRIKKRAGAARRPKGRKK